MQSPLRTNADETGHTHKVNYAPETIAISSESNRNPLRNRTTETIPDPTSSRLPIYGHKPDTRHQIPDAYRYSKEKHALQSSHAHKTSPTDGSPGYTYPSYVSRRKRSNRTDETKRGQNSPCKPTPEVSQQSPETSRTFVRSESAGVGLQIGLNSRKVAVPGDRRCFVRSANKHVVRRSRRFSSVPTRRTAPTGQVSVSETPEPNCPRGQTTSGDSRLRRFQKTARSRSLDSRQSGEDDFDDIVFVFPSQRRFARLLRNADARHAAGVELSTHYARLANDYVEAGYGGTVEHLPDATPTDARHTSGRSSSDSSTETLVPNGRERTLDKRSITMDGSRDEIATFSDLEQVDPTDVATDKRRSVVQPSDLDVAPPPHHAPSTRHRKIALQSPTFNVATSTTSTTPTSHYTPNYTPNHTPNHNVNTEKPPLPPRLPRSGVNRQRPRLKHPFEVIPSWSADPHFEVIGGHGTLETSARRSIADLDSFLDGEL